MISSYLNQTVSHQARSGVDEYNQPTFSTAVDIPAKYEYSRKEVLNREGERVISESVCFTAVEVKAGDIITFDGIEWPVILATPERGLVGEVDHYECRL
jgi:hypothetical protein